MIYTPGSIDPTAHHLKTWPGYFYAVTRCQKRFELRLDDRRFQVGDILILEEWSPITEDYTGQTTKARIDYVLHLKSYGGIKGRAWKLCRWLMPDLVILSIEVLRDE